LDIPKTLMWKQDYVRYLQDGVEITLLGAVDPFSGMACEGQSETNFSNLRALKRDGNKFVLFANSGPNTALNVCAAGLKTEVGDGTANILQFHAQAKVVGDDIHPLDAADLANPAIAGPSITAGALQEFIRGG
jgi:hypothetical protein